MPNSPRRLGNTKLTNTLEFERLLKDAFASDPVALSNLLAQMPLFLWSLRDETWSAVESLVLQAYASTLITVTQYDAIRAAAQATNVPITLP